MQKFRELMQNIGKILEDYSLPCAVLVNTFSEMF